MKNSRLIFLIIALIIANIGVWCAFKIECGNSGSVCRVSNFKRTAYSIDKFYTECNVTITDSFYNDKLFSRKIYDYSKNKEIDFCIDAPDMIKSGDEFHANIFTNIIDSSLHLKMFITQFGSNHMEKQIPIRNGTGIFKFKHISDYKGEIEWTGYYLVDHPRQNTPDKYEFKQGLISR